MATQQKTPYTESGLKKLHCGSLIIATCCQLSLTMVDTQCDKLATVFRLHANLLDNTCNGGRSTDDSLSH